MRGGFGKEEFRPVGFGTSAHSASIDHDRHRINYYEKVKKKKRDQCEQQEW